MREAFDIAIVGGGTVGTVLAMLTHRLAPDAHIAIVDKGMIPPPNKIFSITRGSQLILSEAGVWEQIKPEANRIEQAEISVTGAFGSLLFDSSDLDADGLCHTLQASHLDAALREEMATLTEIKHVKGALTSVRQEGDKALLAIEAEGAETVIQATHCVVTACSDDALKRSGFTRHRHSYGQTIMACMVDTPPAHCSLAIERLSHEGIHAFVPHKRICGLVACVAEDEAHRLAKSEEAPLLEYMTAPYRRNLFSSPPKLEARTSFPLSMHLSHPAHLGSTCLIGSALQTVHPVGGQGMNLALRDAYVWSELYLQATTGGIPASRMHNRYACLRKTDRMRTVATTHSLAKAAQMRNGFLRGASGLGLMAMSLTRPLRRMAAKSVFVGGMSI